jgi:hypothetical protein
LLRQKTLHAMLSSFSIKYTFVLFLFILTACENRIEKPQFTAREVLEMSQKYHDPDENWGQTEFSAHIQEPRTMNPQRYSRIEIDNETGTFKLVRDSDAGPIERMIDEEGTPTVFLNGSSDITEEQKEEFRLDEQRNFGYQSFYTLMYGLPMSLTDEVVDSIGDLQNSTYEGEVVYSIHIELKEAMISKNWELMVNRDNHSLVALRFDHSDDPDWPDEVLVFDGSYCWDEITIPRFRHWYNIETGVYLGSDVIVQ